MGGVTETKFKRAKKSNKKTRRLVRFKTGASYRRKLEPLSC